MDDNEGAEILQAPLLLEDTLGTVDRCPSTRESVTFDETWVNLVCHQTIWHTSYHTRLPPVNR